MATKLPRFVFKSILNYIHVRVSAQNLEITRQRGCDTLNYPEDQAHWSDSKLLSQIPSNIMLSNSLIRPLQILGRHKVIPFLELSQLLGMEDHALYHIVQQLKDEGYVKTRNYGSFADMILILTPLGRSKLKQQFSNKGWKKERELI